MPISRFRISCGLASDLSQFFPNACQLKHPEIGVEGGVSVAMTTAIWSAGMAVVRGALARRAGRVGRYLLNSRRLPFGR